MTAVIYGIKNCDTVKKARLWMKENAIDYTFHDLRIDTLDLSVIQEWINQTGIDILVNKRGTTWKGLDEKTKASLTAENAAQMCLNHPSLVKRPVLVINGKVHIGFDEAAYSRIFNPAKKKETT